MPAPAWDDNMGGELQGIVNGVPRKITIDEAIDRLEKGSFQRKLLYATGMCNGVNAMAVMVLSFIRKAVIIDFGVSVDQSSWFESSVFIGILCGTMVFGPLGDRVGRKPIFLLSSTITAICSLASSYAPTFQALVLLRFGVGIGVGGTVVPFDMLAELTPNHFRGAFLLYVGYFWTLGTSATPALAWYAMQEQGSWRLLLLLCSIPGFVSMFFGYFWVPESPRWLMTKGRSDEALAILKDGAKSNKQNADKVYPPGTTIVLSREEVETVEKMNSVASLFMPEWRFMVVCMLLVWAFLDFIYWGNIQVVTLVFAEYEGNLEIIEPGSQYAYDYGAIIGSSLAEIIGQTAVLVLIDRVGRVPTQAVAYAAGALSVFCLCFVAYIEDTGSATERYVLVLLAFLARMFIMAATSVTWVHTAEMLPTPIRNSAHAVADALAGTGGALSPFLVSPKNSMLFIGIVMGSVTMISATLVWMLPETRGITLGTAISRASSPDLSPQMSLDGSNGSRRVQETDKLSLDESQRQGGDGDDAFDVSRKASNIEEALGGSQLKGNFVVAVEGRKEDYVVEALDDNKLGEDVALTVQHQIPKLI